MGRLDGKVCIITGANSGIGMKTSEVFAREGAKIVMTDVNDSSKEKLLEMVSASDGEGIFVKGDISKLEDNVSLLKLTVDTYGKVDVLINCAGVMENGFKPIDEFSDEDYDFVTNVNIKGTLMLTREALKYMKAQGSGNIVTMGSIAGVFGNGGAVYTSTKGVDISITKHVALRFAGKGIRANCVCPGAVWTPMTRNSINEARSEAAQEFYDTADRHSDLGVGICKPIDVANVLLFLASDESRAITGQIINCDCGCYL